MVFAKITLINFNLQKARRIVKNVVKIYVFIAELDQSKSMKKWDRFFPIYHIKKKKDNMKLLEEKNLQKNKYLIVVWS